MKIEMVKKIIDKSKGGQFHSVEWEKELGVYKGKTDIVTKHSKASAIRLGVAYDNKATVIEKRNLGILPKENQGLPYGEWETDYENYIINTKINSQLRITTSANTLIKTEYRLNGKKVSKKELEGIVTKGELESNSNKLDVFNLKLENIISLK